jgi:hypothetical protein
VSSYVGRTGVGGRGAIGPVLRSRILVDLRVAGPSVSGVGGRSDPSMSMVRSTSVLRFFPAFELVGVRVGAGIVETGTARRMIPFF